MNTVNKLPNKSPRTPYTVPRIDIAYSIVVATRGGDGVGRFRVTERTIVRPCSPLARSKEHCPNRWTYQTAMDNIA